MADALPPAADALPPAALSGRVALARVSGTPLDPEACRSAVSDRAAGAIGLFVGVVREHDDGRPVRTLSYEAHPTAESVMAAVCERVATGGIIAVAAEHRTGDLAVGDIAVVVAVSAEHRAKALHATQVLIDAIKHDVPIWKRQVFADGTEEWVGSC